MEREKIFKNYVAGNINRLCQLVQEKFEEKRFEIRSKLIEVIKSYLVEGNDYYEWIPGVDPWAPWDRSGSLKQIDIDFTQTTVAEFLEDVCSGEKEASFERGRGWNYLTYGDELSYTTLEIGEAIMQDAVYADVKKIVDVTEKEFQDWFYEFHDEIYDNTLACNFFGWEFPVDDFAKLSDVKLEEILKM